MHTHSCQIMPGAKRKLSFVDSKVLAAAKKIRGASSSSTKTTFAKKVKTIVLRNSETKISNGATNWVGVGQNIFFTPNGVIGNATSLSLNGPKNLLYCEVGPGGFQRDGEKIHCKHVEVQVMFATPSTGRDGITNTFAYTNNTLFRVLVYELTRAESVNGTTVPADVLTDNYLYNETVGPATGSSGAQGNWLMREFNKSKYRLLKDFIVDNKSINQATGGAVDDYYVWTPNLKLIRFKIPVNKTVDYGDPSTLTTTCVPNKTMQLLIIPFNNINFGNGEPLGSIKVTHSMHFKDI